MCSCDFHPFHGALGVYPVTSPCSCCSWLFEMLWISEEVTPVFSDFSASIHQKEAGEQTVWMNPALRSSFFCRCSLVLLCLQVFLFPPALLGLLVCPQGMVLTAGNAFALTSFLKENCRNWAENPVCSSVWWWGSPVPALISSCGSTFSLRNARAVMELLCGFHSCACSTLCILPCVTLGAFQPSPLSPPSGLLCLWMVFAFLSQVSARAAHSPCAALPLDALAVCSYNRNESCFSWQKECTICN